MMDRRSFLGCGTVAATSILLGARLENAWGRGTNETAASPIVPTSSGKIRGIGLNKVYAFKGIPYGASTEGARRVLPPAKPEPWTGVRDALEFGHRSPQGPSGLIPEVAAMDRQEPAGEGWLVLNLWR